MSAFFPNFSFKNGLLNYPSPNICKKEKLNPGISPFLPHQLGLDPKKQYKMISLIPLWQLWCAEGA